MRQRRVVPDAKLSESRELKPLKEFATSSTGANSTSNSSLAPALPGQRKHLPVIMVGSAARSKWAGVT
jgi:hypothetical protein